MDAVKVIGLYALFVVAPFWWSGLMYWTAFWIILGVFVALSEGVTVLLTGRTLSQRFWKWAKTNPVRKWGVFLSLTAFYVYLILHLWLKL